MTAQETFQTLVKEALSLHGNNKWGSDHSMHVINGLYAIECGAEAKDMAETDAAKLAKKVVNPSAFAQWMESNVKGFKRETKKEKGSKLVEGFSLDAEAKADEPAK